MEMAEKIKLEKEKMIEERRKALEVDETPPADPPQDPPQDQDPPPPPTDPPPEDWEQKYRTLEGKYRAEVPRLHGQVKELTEQVKSLAMQIEGSRAAPAPEFEEDGKTPVYRSKYVTDEMRATDAYKWRASEYGISEAEYAAEMSVLAAQGQVKPMEEKIGNIQVETAQERFDRDLHGICPSWTGVDSGINTDPKFAEWLKAEDQLDAANAAYGDGDFQKLARIIQRFEKTTTKPPTADPPEHLAAPHRKGGGTQTQIDNAKADVLKYSDMQELYASFNRGEWRGKEAEYQKEKAKFMKAKEEGRLI